MTATQPEFTEDVRKCAAEQAISEEDLAKGMVEKSKEFATRGSELYAKT